jgi:hypothetical protein
MDGSRIPLTEDPAEGYVAEWIDEGQRVGNSKYLSPVTG